MCASKLRYFFNTLAEIIYYTLFSFWLEGWVKPSLHPFQHSRFEVTRIPVVHLWMLLNFIDFLENYKYNDIFAVSTEYFSGHPLLALPPPFSPHGIAHWNQSFSNVSRWMNRLLKPWDSTLKQPSMCGTCFQAPLEKRPSLPHVSCDCDKSCI